MKLNVKAIANAMLILKKPFSGTKGMYLHIRPTASRNHADLVASKEGECLLTALAIPCSDRSLEAEEIVVEWQALDAKIKALKKAKISAISVSSRRETITENDNKIQIDIATLTHAKGSYEIRDLRESVLTPIDPRTMDADRVEDEEVAVLFADEFPELGTLASIAHKNNDAIRGVWVTDAVLMATDGHRMMRMDRKEAKALEGYEPVLLPTEVAEALAYADAKKASGPDAWIYDDGEVRIASTGDYAIAWVPDQYLRMPDYTMIPSHVDGMPVHLVLTVDAIREAIALIAPAVSKTNAVVVSANNEGDDPRLRLLAQNVNTLTESEVFAACGIVNDTREGQRINLNVSYFADAIDMLARHGSEEIEIAYAENTSPAVMRAKDRPGDVHIVMPMRF